MQVVGQLSEIEVQTVVTAVGPGTITLSVNDQPLMISLPAGIQLPAKPPAPADVIPAKAARTATAETPGRAVRATADYDFQVIVTFFSTALIALRRSPTLRR
jgi:hypothetical protein